MGERVNLSFIQLGKLENKSYFNRTLSSLQKLILFGLLLTKNVIKEGINVGLLWL